MSSSDSPVVTSSKLNGTFKGKYQFGGSVEQFLGLKYASIKQRWELPVLVEDYNSKHLDLSKQGPICPQDTPYKDSLIGIPPGKVIDFDLSYDELNCLSLIITRPRVPSLGHEKLPVICWIHGGGNMAGTPYRKLCDFSNLVDYAAKNGRPFIGVGIQYRVGMLGFLPFNGIGNYALHDQKAALEWISRNIGEFGGDHNKITLMGQSSGSWCVLTQAISNGHNHSGFFQRIAAFSGSTSSIPLVSLQDYEKRAQEIADGCGTSLQELRTIPWQTLVKVSQHDLGMTVAFPVDDGIFLPGSLYGTTPEGLEAVCISDCKEDAYFWIEFMEDPKSIQKTILNSPGGEKIVESYKIDGLSCEKIADLLTDCIFCAANERMDINLRKSDKTSVYRLLFDVTNPHDRSFGNNHMVDVICLFDSYDCENPQAQEMIQEFQNRMLEFSYGEAPWDESRVLLIDDTGSREVDFEDRKIHRRLHLFDVIEGFDKIHSQLFHKLTFTGW